MDPRIENFLGVDDYIQADFSQPGEVPVNLYVAYYASQRKGVSPHSPRVCIPGGGWLISSLDRIELPVQAAGLTSLPVNRVLIVRNNQRQLVYYWFDQRGRKISNEYLMKWHLLNDSIRMNRTDGALVRLVTPVLAGETIEEAESRIKGFLNLLLPQLSNYIPA
jgi:EpsI family protein